MPPTYYSSGNVPHYRSYQITMTPQGKVLECWGWMTSKQTFNDNTTYTFNLPQPYRSTSEMCVTMGYDGHSDCAAMCIWVSGVSSLSVQSQRYSNGSDSLRVNYYVRGFVD